MYMCYTASTLSLQLVATVSEDGPHIWLFHNFLMQHKSGTNVPPHGLMFDASTDQFGNFLLLREIAFCQYLVTTCVQVAEICKSKGSKQVDVVPLDLSDMQGIDMFSDEVLNKY